MHRAHTRSWKLRWTRATRSWLPWVACLLALAAGPAAAAQLAIVTDLQGAASIQDARGVKPLDILADFAGGEEIAVEAGARLTVTYLRSGDEFLVSGPARVSVGPDQLRGRSGAAPQRRASPLAAASGKFVAARGVVQGAVRMRGGPQALALVEPAGKLLKAPSKFAWKNAPDGATVRVALAEDGNPATLWEAETKGSELALPPQVALVAGQPYAWTLSYREGGRTRTLEATFEIAEPAQAREWEQLRPARDAALSDWVVYAALLKASGYTGEASQVWSQLAGQRPGSAELRALAGQ